MTCPPRDVSLHTLLFLHASACDDPDVARPDAAAADAGDAGTPGAVSQKYGVSSTAMGMERLLLVALAPWATRASGQLTAAGKVYVSDHGNNAIRVIANQKVITLAGTGTKGFKDGKRKPFLATRAASP